MIGEHEFPPPPAGEAGEQSEPEGAQTHRPLSHHATRADSSPARGGANRKLFTAAIVVGAVAGMTGLAFAAAPLYDMFCRVTGFGGTPQLATAAPSRVLDQRIQIRFDSNVAPGMPIEFRPAPTQTLRLGETGLAFYHVRNLSDQPVTAIASYNVAPHKMGPYFQKLECFCFQERTLAPGEEAELPVVFFVDPEMASDLDTREVETVTLSYTLFRSTEEATAALTQ
jgi:cytochrome c oxidase assembly protein subunit 11